MTYTLQTMDATRKLNNPHPQEKTGIISNLFFWWMRDLFSKGLSKDLGVDDLYNTLQSDLSEPLGDQLERNWMEQLSKSEHDNKKKPSLSKALVATFSQGFILSGILMFLYAVVFRTLQPIFLSRFICYFTNKDDNRLSDAYLNALGISVTALILVLLSNYADYLSSLTSMRIRIASCSLLYRKIVHLSSSHSEKNYIGHVVNLMSNDVLRFEGCNFMLHCIWIAPLQILVFTVVMWRAVGPALLVGVSAMMLQSLPLQAYLGIMTAKFRLKIAERTDARVRLMGEIVSGIQVIKMYVWEKPFEKLVELSRRLEINFLTKSSYLNAFRCAVPVFSQKVSLFVTLVTCNLLRYEITSDKVFAIANMFISLELTICICVPIAVKRLSEVTVTIQRLQNFLLLEENEGLIPVGIPTEKQGVLIDNATVRWTPSTVVDALHCVSLQVPKGQLCVVVGPVGAGKTSLLQAIIGELPLSSGIISLGGELSYASQEPWLFTGTVRQNILFGRQYDAKRYNEVISVCALQQDLDLFPNGDRSTVGERGISLSGGQRTRINLARAVYHKADIYLLDDPLSAVDMHVSNHLFHECINTFLAGKTRILITHQIQHLHFADHIILLKDGCIENQGTYKELKALNIDITTFMSNNMILEEDQNIAESTFTTEVKDPIELEYDNDETDNYPEADENAELVAKGKLKSSVYTKYWLAGSSTSSLVIMLVIFVIGQVASSTTDYWVSIWAQNEELRKSHSHVDFHNLSGSLPNITSSWNKLLINQIEDTTLIYMTITSEINSSESTTLTPLFTNDNIVNSSGFNSITATDLSTLENGKKEMNHIKQEIEIEFNASLNMNETNSDVVLDVVKEMGSTIHPTTNPVILSKKQQDKIDYEDNFTSSDLFSMKEGLPSLNMHLLQEYTSGNLSQDNIPYNMNTSSVQQYNNTGYLPLVYSTVTCITVYIICLAVTIVLVIARALLFIKMCMKSSKCLHDNMFANVLRTNMRFFHTNPSGRILNRFSKDIGEVDELLPSYMLECTQIITTMLGITVLILVVNYTMIVLVILTVGVFYKSRKIYLASAQNLQRLEGITKSPIFSHVSASMNGLPTIRVNGAQEMLRKEFDTLQDYNTSVFQLIISARKCFSLSMDIMNVIITTGIAFSFLLFGRDMPGSHVGLALTQAIILSGMVHYGAFLSGMITCQMTSVERLLQYTTLPPESDLYSNSEKKAPMNWPAKGAIQLTNVNMKFSPSGPIVLRDISINIQPGHKVGIVGRTGAGKTSLVTTLFRVTPIEGLLHIDGIDIASLGLHDIRKKISIIPQEPVLFTASLRNNLDPLGEYSDYTLWNALEEVQLKEVVSSLDFAVNESGSNFSVGQRQLLCLARAIIQENKILILDEATANIDLNTDALIQKTIRLKFQDCTVLTVAHRINTIMDSDAVIVMDAGKIVEHDHPHILLQNRDGFFYKMVQETGRDMTSQLEIVAKESYTNHLEKEAKRSEMQKKEDERQHQGNIMKKNLLPKAFPGSQPLFDLHQVVQEAYRRHKENEPEAIIELKEMNQQPDELQTSGSDNSTETPHDKGQENI